jgi:hypothetical protein
MAPGHGSFWSDHAYTRVQTSASGTDGGAEPLPWETTAPDEDDENQTRCRALRTAPCVQMRRDPCSATIAVLLVTFIARRLGYLHFNTAGMARDAIEKTAATGMSCTPSKHRLGRRTRQLLDRARLRVDALGASR